MRCHHCLGSDRVAVLLILKHEITQVISATHRSNNQTYAVKMIDKAHIIRHRKVKYATIEKTCLARLGAGRSNGTGNTARSPDTRNHARKPSGLGPNSGGHPGVIRMFWAFHDESSLCEFSLAPSRLSELRLTLTLVM